MTPIHAQIVGLLCPFPAQLHKRKYGYEKIDNQQKNVDLLTEQAPTA